MAHFSKSNILSRRLALAVGLAAFAGWFSLSNSSLNLFSPTAHAAGFVVTNTNDSGAGSLRQAILDAKSNGSASLDVINFNIPGAGLHTIKPLSELPTITPKIMINGYSQPGAAVNTLAVGDNAILLIELDGTNAGSAFGLLLTQDDTVKGLVINRFNHSGILVDSNNNVIEGCYIGTNATGDQVAGQMEDGVFIGGSNNKVGGTAAAARNVIAGNKYHGVSIAGNNLQVNANSNTVQGNYIGTNAAGTAALANGTGLSVYGSAQNNLIGGTDPGAGNTISGNLFGGIRVQGAFKGTTGTNIQGNHIGVAADGKGPLGNQDYGVQIVDAQSTFVGGIVPGATNIIGFNSPGGVRIDPGSVNNTIRGNSIHSNSDSGIDLGSFGVTPNDLNDADIGANDLQNFPVLTLAQDSGASTLITGTLNSTANTTFNIDLYLSPTCDPSGHGEGQTFLGTLTVPAVGNDNSFNSMFPGFHAGEFVTATATSPTGSTSEFSQCRQVTSALAGTLQFSQPTSVVNENAGNATITVTRAGGSSGAISVQYATVVGGSATANSDYTPVSGTLNWESGDASSKTFTVPIANDPDYEPGGETINLALSSPAGGGSLGSPNSSSLTINDDDLANPTFHFSQGNYSVQEELGTVTLTVTRDGDPGAPAAVDYATSDTSAQQKADYEIAAGTLRFAAGEITRTLVILINEDSHIEADETFKVTLSNPSGASLGQASTTVVSIVDDLPETATNPIDDAQKFVYMQYHDFLNREPDPAGLQFWTSEITSCGSDAACIETRRTNVSTAFFLSIEFQQTGYLLYLFQKESFATLPKYDSFMRDLQEVSQGVVVNAAGWEQKLAANQEQFAAAWVNRPSFKAAYDGMSNEAYVNTLYSNAGIVPSQAERDALVTKLDTVNQSRAAVLLDVAANSAFRQREQNSAFVLTQYFSYLRRDPNSSPDSDLSGYYFWLTKLNSFDGDYQRAEMVKAFLISGEYRGRFGLQ